MQEQVKLRLLMHINFLEEEVKDYSLFEQLTWETFRTDRSKRRDVERWIENIVNASIDMSKIILTSEEISRWVKFRNIISHKYLDIRWSSIKRFISETKPLYEGFLNKAKKYLNKKLLEESKR